MFTIEESQPLVVPVVIADKDNEVVCVINALKFAGAKRNLDKTWNVYLQGTISPLTLTADQFKQLFQKLQR
jgi:hypothetical protein